MKKIILIGGVAGTGKTSMARTICNDYNIDHRLGTGFIREIVKTETYSPSLNSHTYRVSCQQSYNHLVNQAELLKDSIVACIDRAMREGTSLVIEGNHLIPWILFDSEALKYLKRKGTLKCFILYVDDPKKHRKMVEGDTHKTRGISDEEFGRIIEMQESLMFLAKKYKIPVIKAGDYEKVKKLLE